LTNSVLAKTSEIIIYVSQQALKFAQGIAFNIPKYIIGAVFCIVATVFMSLDFPGIKFFILEQFSYNKQKIILDSKKYVVETFGRIVTSYALIMFITMSELYIGLTIISVPDAMVLSVLIAMFDILPALGTGGIMLPWILIRMLDQDYTFAGQLFVIYVFITVVRNFLEPKIVGDSIGLHPVIMLMSIFLGVSIFGILGILIMPFTLIVIKRLNDSGRIHLFKSSYIKEEEALGFFELKRRAKLKRQVRREKEEAEEELLKIKRAHTRKKRAEDIKEKAEAIRHSAKETLLKVTEKERDDNES
jgi:sporulation integral membrane protein YtvI